MAREQKQKKRHTEGKGKEKLKLGISNKQKFPASIQKSEKSEAKLRNPYRARV